MLVHADPETRTPTVHRCGCRVAGLATSQGARTTSASRCAPTAGSSPASGGPDAYDRVVHAAYNNGSWHHVAFTRTRATGALALYIDGAAAGTATGSTLSAPSRYYNLGRLATANNDYADSLDQGHRLPQGPGSPDHGATKPSRRRPRPAASGSRSVPAVTSGRTTTGPGARGLHAHPVQRALGGRTSTMPLPEPRRAPPTHSMRRAVLLFGQQSGGMQRPGGAWTVHSDPVKAPKSSSRGPGRTGARHSPRIVLRIVIPGCSRLPDRPDTSTQPPHRLLRSVTTGATPRAPSIPFFSTG